jgi:UDP-N-acetylmuramate--alanine ligase
MKVTLKLPGRHNVQNALASIAVAHEVGVSESAIRQALSDFKGIDRRFQMRTLSLKSGGEVLLVDDYGHHPQEISSVFRAIREGWQNRRLVVAFQPHRYTRTRDLFKEFVEVLSTVDLLLLLDVYTAGESVIAGAEGKDLYQAIQQYGKVQTLFVERHQQLAEKLSPVLRDEDIVLTVGAGSIGLASANLANPL